MRNVAFFDVFRGCNTVAAVPQNNADFLIVGRKIKSGSWNGDFYQRPLSGKKFKRNRFYDKFCTFCKRVVAAGFVCYRNGCLSDIAVVLIDRLAIFAAQIRTLKSNRQYFGDFFLTVINELRLAERNDRVNRFWQNSKSANGKLNCIIVGRKTARHDFVLSYRVVLSVSIFVNKFTVKSGFIVGSCKSVIFYAVVCRFITEVYRMRFGGNGQRFWWNCYRKRTLHYFFVIIGFVCLVPDHVILFCVFCFRESRDVITFVYFVINSHFFRDFAGESYKFLLWTVVNQIVSLKSKVGFFFFSPMRGIDTVSDFVCGNFHFGCHSRTFWNAGNFCSRPAEKLITFFYGIDQIHSLTFKTRYCVFKRTVNIREFIAAVVSVKVVEDFVFAFCEITRITVFVNMGVIPVIVHIIAFWTSVAEKFVVIPSEHPFCRNTAVKSPVAWHLNCRKFGTALKHIVHISNVCSVETAQIKTYKIDGVLKHAFHFLNFFSVEIWQIKKRQFVTAEHFAHILNISCYKFAHVKFFNFVDVWKHTAHISNKVGLEVCSEIYFFKFREYYGFKIFFRCDLSCCVKCSIERTWIHYFKIPVR